MKNNNYYILHFPGQSKYLLSEVEYRTDIKVDENITVITTVTEDSVDKSVILKQTDRILNCAEGQSYDGNWDMRLKIKWLMKSLEKVKTDYVLLLDGLDVVINKDIDSRLIELYKEYSSPVVYGVTTKNFPKELIESAVLLSQRKYLYDGFYSGRLNGGCCFGKTKEVRKVYEKASELLEKASSTSEQFYLRNVRKDNPDLIEVDYKRKMFANIHLDDFEMWGIEWKY